jgi:SAM-dependent methyltransferase
MPSKDDEHAYLVDGLWNSRSIYYDAMEGSVEGFDGNAGLQDIQRICRQARTVLDCGCGEGRKLASMLPKEGAAYGIDISRLGLKRAKRFSDIRVVQGDLESLPFLDQFFEATFSAYVMEHVANPERVLDEMIRVTRPNGYVAVIAPNYGSPIFPSPPSQARRRFRDRGIRRLLRTHLDLFRQHVGSLRWDSVRPLVMEMGRYEMDWDTTIEPYLHTLVKYLHGQGLNVIACSSQFEMIPQPPMSFQVLLSSNVLGLFVRFLRFLANRGIAPYKYYGPVCYAMAQKR